MDNWNIPQIVEDLSTLIKRIKKFEIPIVLDELENLEASLSYSDENIIKIDNLEFNLDNKKISGTNPPEIDTFQIFFKNTCRFDVTRINSEKDVIVEYSFQIDIEGYDKEANVHYSCWHLDKNIESETPKFTHPYYHFQFGGNTVEEKDPGQLLILGSPRLPHPPMDLFLGFHFIINNFFSSKDYKFVHKLLDDHEYQEIIRRAQNRMWKPYFSAFGQTTNLDYTLNNVFPLYIQ